MTKPVLELNTNELEKWARTLPNPVEVLAAKARISSKTANAILFKGLVPGQSGTRWRVSMATEIPETTLFPESDSRRKRRRLE